MSHSDVPEEKLKRKRRIPERLQLNDSSCRPGLALMERLAECRKPAAEDIAIIECWAFRFPITYA